jgi:hypothetical protein
MRILTSTICAALAVALVAAGPAAAETDTFQATGHLALKHSGPGSRVVYAGPVRSPGFGKGTATNIATVNADGTTTAEISVRFEFGTLTARTTGTVTSDAGGNSTFRGSGTINGGTRAYQDARGAFRYFGKSVANGSITYKIDGKVKFPTR